LFRNLGLKSHMFSVYDSEWITIRCYRVGIELEFLG
jgi:hypothetical protein